MRWQVVEADLLQAAFARTKAIADGLSIPCYWPNVALPTAPANVHLRASVMSIRPRVIGTGGKARSKWALQIAVWVRDGVGAIAPATTGDAIAAELPLGAVIAGASRMYTITEPVELIASVKADGWYVTPYRFELEHID
jgi:hypothetical protein